jgi:hypothetical protein
LEGDQKDHNRTAAALKTSVTILTLAEESAGTPVVLPMEDRPKSDSSNNHVYIKEIDFADTPDRGPGTT